MDVHPKDIPVFKTYELQDEKDAAEAAEDMVHLGFKNRKKGFRVLMPKSDSKMAKRMGYAVTTGVTHGLRQAGETRDIKYWTYHHDKDRYAIVLINRESLEAIESAG